MSPPAASVSGELQAQAAGDWLREEQGTVVAAGRAAAATTTAAARTAGQQLSCVQLLTFALVFIVLSSG